MRIHFTICSRHVSNDRKQAVIPLRQLWEKREKCLALNILLIISNTCPQIDCVHLRRFRSMGNRLKDCTHPDGQSYDMNLWETGLRTAHTRTVKVMT